MNSSSPGRNPLPSAHTDSHSDLDRALAAAVAHARSNSAFYKQKLAHAPHITRAPDLATLPLTTKREVSQSNQDFWCPTPDPYIDFCTTSGTTGIPTLYPLTQKDLDRLGQNEQACFDQVGIKPGDVVMLAVTLDKCFMAGLAYFEGLRRIGATIIRVGAGSPAMLLATADRLKPAAVVSVPSFLKRVAAYATQQNIDPAQSTIRKLICIGEPVRDSNFQLTDLGQHISRAFRAQVYSTYGITELACSMCECEAGQGGHVNPQFVHAEILDETGSPVPDGTPGQLVATSIGVTAMPLVRFATGDITFLTRSPCPCGRTTPRIGPILGRRDQAMKLKGTTVYPAAVQRSLQSLDQVIDYVMIATAPTPLSDELEVVVAVRGNPADALDSIREKLRGDLKITPAVRAAPLPEITALTHSTDLRKQRVFLDRRPKTS